MRLLDERELEGVMAHELAHVKHRDILISSVAATIAAAIMMIANIARFMALGGVVAVVIVKEPTRWLCWRL